tara:strand:- start:131 stop:391 length:261 start_codon:yes stop_codon:yes gene_type:complete
MSKIIGMSGKQPPKGPKRTEPGLQLNPKDLKDIVCEQCGSKYFRQVQGFKIVSALQSPTGKEQIMPIPTFRCDDCGFINKEFRIEK